ncbi:hypothetical protein GJAV_G00047910 [Gymnothorax javanicus]|nr:hypothetical protein GJAV_G00047910 [Gymnothorax javanicus]
MPTPNVTSVFLPYWESGERRIRFLHLAGSSSFKICDSSNAEETVTPLFLGADLFSKTNIRTENHQRYHAKFAKKGLATKLVFSSEFRFHGLRLPSACNSLWFYSIQGLFRVAFELYNKQEQLFVLETFQELWKSRLNDGPLNPCYTLSKQLDAPSPSEIIAIHNKDIVSKLTSQNTSGSHLDEPQRAEVPDVGREDDAPPEDARPAANHDYCGPDDGQSANQPDTLRLVFERLASLDKALKASKHHTETEVVIMLLMDLAEKFVTQTLDEAALADVVSELLRTQGPGPRAGDSVYSSPLLRAVSGWLGKQFQAANGCISRQVEDFKMRHIEHITDLPPAEELVDELFPEAMRALLLSWMGLDEDSALWKRQSEYPIVLLILEFANHNLITGVAHVLYSSLICK